MLIHIYIHVHIYIQYVSDCLSTLVVGKAFPADVLLVRTAGGQAASPGFYCPEMPRFCWWVGPRPLFPLWIWMERPTWRRARSVVKNQVQQLYWHVSSCHVLIVDIIHHSFLEALPGTEFCKPALRFMWHARGQGYQGCKTSQNNWDATCRSG